MRHPLTGWDDRATDGPESERCTLPGRTLNPTRGRFYEDFEIGAVFQHHWGRTLTEGECSLFTTWTMNANPLYFNREYARNHGHPGCPANPMLILNVVFGLTVEDLSEQALAHLGYWNVRFGDPVYAGDTLVSESRILDKRESESKKDRGIVHVRTTGFNQQGVSVLEYERKILVKKRSAFEKRRAQG
jgi:itaconyl-CoA hydratase